MRDDLLGFEAEVLWYITKFKVNNDNVINLLSHLTKTSPLTVSEET